MIHGPFRNRREARAARMFKGAWLLVRRALARDARRHRT